MHIYITEEMARVTIIFLLFWVVGHEFMFYYYQQLILKFRVLFPKA
jgi:hypothetical protein